MFALPTRAVLINRSCYVLLPFVLWGLPQGFISWGNSPPTSRTWEFRFFVLCPTQLVNFFSQNEHCTTTSGSLSIPAKALRDREHIASHWSTSHTQWWSALRYLVHPSLKKEVVDTQPFVWTCDSRQLDLYAESQEPYQATMWKRRREEHELSVSAGHAKKAKFTKLDLTSVILSKNLTTKNLLLEYAQEFGSAGMQLFVHQNQKRMKEILEEAQEWGSHALPGAVVCRAPHLVSNLL